VLINQQSCFFAPVLHVHNSSITQKTDTRISANQSTEIVIITDKTWQQKVRDTTWNL